MGQYITDITHLAPVGQIVDLPKEALHFRNYLGRIIGAATSRSNLVSLTSGLPCRVKVGRGQCSGTLAVARQDLPTPMIRWQCTDCDEGGEITGWRSHYFDMSKFPESKPEEGDEVMSVEISPAEFAALLNDECTYDADSEKIVLTAERTAEGVRLSGWEGDIDNLAGFIASNANHTKDKKLEKRLLSVFDKVEENLNELSDKRNV